MSPTLGTKLGPYEILAPIGAGGMGEVWKARDTRLDRVVAIKVSKVHFTERFEREARAVAALNHPHVCQLYDVGPDYLVMEFVEGVPLKGPLPLNKAVEYAGQILDALDAAHCKGITHRDLKPENILVTKQGIKLLDFGLAKQSGPLKETDGTLTSALTGQGQILGTLQYMSPEQLNGKEADARSDLFSFGCVLYEMLTGRRAFEGQSAASVIAAIMEREPAPLGEAPPLSRVVQRSLAKDPDQRFQTARDLKAALTWALEQPPPVRPLRRSWLPWAIAAVLVLVGIAGWAAWWRATRVVEQGLRPLVRLDVDLGPDVSLNSYNGADVILSPDGQRLVFVSRGRLFTRRLDQPNAIELGETEGAYAPFFSPDGHWVAFFAQGMLKKVAMEGGAAVTLCGAPSGFGGSWGEDGNVIAALNAFGPLSRISSGGGLPKSITQMDREHGEVTHRWPQILPGGKAVLFTTNSTMVGGFDGATIEVMSLENHQRKPLQRGGTFGRYLPSGHLLYVNRGTLFAVPFDVERLEVRGTPTAVLEQIAYNPRAGYAPVAFSGASSGRGTLLFRSGGAGGTPVTVQWLDGDGNMRPLLAKAGFYWAPRLSPDGERLAMQVLEGPSFETWVYEWRNETLTHLSVPGAYAASPIWSPDGRYLVSVGIGGMFWARSDGAGKPQPLTHSRNHQTPWSFTRDGKRLAFMELADVELGYDIWTVPVESDAAGLRAGEPEPFLKTSSDERHPSFSPDGRWLAYTSNETGTYQVYVRAFPDRGGKWQISNGGGAYVVWSRQNHELFFRTLDGQIMIAEYTVGGDSFAPQRPRVWSEKRLANFGPLTNPTYDLAPDGKRIAALMPAEGPDAQAHHVIFLQNFYDELRRRVPVRK